MSGRATSKGRIEIEKTGLVKQLNTVGETDDAVRQLKMNDLNNSQKIQFRKMQFKAQ